MTPDDQAPKIVQPGPVEFEDDTTRPDSLEERAGRGTQSHILALPDEDVEVMEHLSCAVAPLFQKVNGKYSTRTRKLTSEEIVDVGPIAPLLAYIVTLTKRKGAPCVARISVDQAAIDPKRVAGIIEGIFGPEIAPLGFYEAVGITDGKLDIARLTHYFPQFSAIRQLHDKLIPLVHDPYLTILSLRPRHRPFFTGLTRALGIAADNTFVIEEFYKPWALKDIFQHAKNRGEVHLAKKYVDLVLGDPP